MHELRDGSACPGEEGTDMPLNNNETPMCPTCGSDLSEDLLRKYGTVLKPGLHLAKCWKCDVEWHVSVALNYEVQGTE
jgi:formate dehydrogenase maturation protein FdhE